MQEVEDQEQEKEYNLGYTFAINIPIANNSANHPLVVLCLVLEIIYSLQGQATECVMKDIVTLFCAITFSSHFDSFYMYLLFIMKFFIIMTLKLSLGMAV